MTRAQAEVVNTPSDLPGNTERPVANGIFSYPTAKEAGAADKVVVNGGKTITTVASGSIPLPVHSVDQFANPAAGQVHVRIVPSSLASYEDGKLTPHRTAHRPRCPSTRASFRRSPPPARCVSTTRCRPPQASSSLSWRRGSR